MQVERWKIPPGEVGREEWLARRKSAINGSEIGALFGCSPFMTLFSLYADKAGLADVAAPDSAVMRRGRILEPAVAAAVQEQRPEWKIVKSSDYLFAPDAGLGCTPDFDVWCPNRGLGVLQSKTAAKPIFENDWEGGPPFWIILQTHLEMMLSDVGWSAIAVLIMSTFTIDCKIYEFTRHEAAEGKILTTVARFWSDLAAGKAPSPDYARDDEIIKQIYPRDNGATIDLTGDNRMPELLSQFEMLSALSRQAEADLKAVKAEIAAKLGDATAARLPGWEVTNKTQERAGYVVEPKSFRVLRIKRTKAERVAA